MVNQKFQNESQDTQLLYNFTDIAEGTGIVVLYGFVDGASTGQDYKLSSQQFYSRQKETSEFSSTSATFESLFDEDFDLGAFQRNQVLNGTGYMQVGLWTETGASTVGECYFILTIYSWDGSTETQLATAQSETYQNNNLAGEHEILLFPITISNQTIKQGDQLRCRVEFWGRRVSGASTWKMVFGHDPQNRDGTRVTPSSQDIISRMEFYIPFKVFR